MIFFIYFIIKFQPKYTVKCTIRPLNTGIIADVIQFVILNFIRNRTSSKAHQYKCEAFFSKKR
ncbi:hypothetical protein EGY05_16015 [Chryseobacterium arthrosphaerae]|nr:hypothetical protein EGY05_16015 [Chryseobacterium arthrosphaerae]